MSVHVRAGLTASSPILTDQVATPAMAQLLGARMDEEVRVAPASGLTVGGGLRAAFWPRMGLTADVDYTITELQADDGADTRAVQDLGMLQALIGVNWSVRPSIEVGGGAGLLWYRTDDRGLFAEGADTSPVAEARLAWTPPLLNGRLAITGAAQTHRFGTPVIRSEGGQDGIVTRYTIAARMTLLEAGQ